MKTQAYELAIRNYVSKNCNKFNKPVVHKDKKKQYVRVKPVRRIPDES